MKKIAKEKLDELLFSDRANQIKAVDDKGKQYTLRGYWRYLLDQQVNGSKYSRDTIKTIDKIYDALAEGELNLEDADYDYLKKHIDNIGIPFPSVYKTCTLVIDGAEEYKAS